MDYQYYLKVFLFGTENFDNFIYNDSANFFMEKGLHDFLVEWTVNFVRNKDVISKKIEKIEHEKNGFDLYVKYRDREQYFIISSNIDKIDSIIEKIKDVALSNIFYFFIVTLNSKHNLDALLKNWNKLSNFKMLSIIFLNPFSGLDKKWIISPHVHNKICDKNSLETGLRSIFDTVEQIEEEKLLQLIGQDSQAK